MGLCENMLKHSENLLFRAVQPHIGHRLEVIRIGQNEILLMCGTCASAGMVGPDGDYSVTSIGYAELEEPEEEDA